MSSCSSVSSARKAASTAAPSLCYLISTAADLQTSSSLVIWAPSLPSEFDISEPDILVDTTPLGLLEALSREQVGLPYSRLAETQADRGGGHYRKPGRCPAWKAVNVFATGPHTNDSSQGDGTGPLEWMEKVSLLTSSNPEV